MSLGCFNVINSYPPFDCHAKKGIDNLPLHPFTLLLYSWKHQSEQTITNSIVVQICSSVDYLDGIKKILLCDGLAAAMDLGSSEPKIGNKNIFPKSQNEGPRIHCGKNMVEYHRYFAAAGNL